MTHLSGEQIAQWMAGDRTAEAEAHVAACAACRSEVAGFEQVLQGFRRSAVGLPVGSVHARQTRSAWPRWVTAAAAIALLAMAPVYRQQQERKRAALEQQDAQLLQEVDAEISRAVPDAMDPLVRMVSWNSGEEQK